MLKQYNKIKIKYPDSILFFRLGDFYEMFFDDAKTASRVLGITLTSRNKNDKNPVPLCGVPYHSAESYLTRLLNNGYKVAICEQVEDPKFAKGVVKRRVVKVLTPGAIIDSEKLDSKSNNYIVCIYHEKNKCALSYADISTGEFRVTEFNELNTLGDELSHLEPKEIIVKKSSELKEINILNNNIGSNAPLITNFDSHSWDTDIAQDLLLHEFNVSTLKGFGLEGKKCSQIACAVLLDYIKETQMEYIPKMDVPHFYNISDYLNIDESTKRNLELFGSLSGETKNLSLLWVLDKTQTAMGARLLKHWINYPLKQSEEIVFRQDGVEELRDGSVLRKKLMDELKNVYDIERLTGRITTVSARPRDLSSLRGTSYTIAKLKNFLSKVNSKILCSLEREIDELSDIRNLLNESIVEDPPYNLKDGGVIKSGYNDDLDQLRSIQKDGRSWISNLEESEREKTGISSLKVGYNRVFGYYIEVTKTNLKRVPDYYIRRQTLTNAERFITPELKDCEEKILNAEEKITELEKEIFESIRLKVSQNSERIRKVSSVIAEIDVICSLSEVAHINDYVRPEVTDENIIELKDSRHPVVEMMETDQGFVPNDIHLNGDENQLLLITGPNMAGKSTLIRQTALIVIMAQIGGFIPASYGKLGVCDKVFTRVGATDNLAKGFSTFMVEMVETANILRNATRSSLVILDEIGRGTSTFDGMSIAWAVSEYLNDLGVKTLFATHYHELAQLENVRTGIKNFNVLVKEEKDRIIFLRKLVPGATSHSYGIQVAKLAGVPNRVVNSAKKILSSLEVLQSKLSESMSGEQFGLFSNIEEIDIAEEDYYDLVEEIREIDPMNITPIEALNILIKLKEKAEKS